MNACAKSRFSLLLRGMKITCVHLSHNGDELFDLFGCGEQQTFLLRRFQKTIWSPLFLSG